MGIILILIPSQLLLLGAVLKAVDADKENWLWYIAGLMGNALCFGLMAHL